MKKSILKSIGAIAAGLIFSFILTVATDTLLESTGVFPGIEEQKKYGFKVFWMDLLAIVYRCIYTVLGGYLTARLAPQNPMRHVILLGSIGTVLAIIGSIAVSANPEMANVLPLWFTVALVLTAFPCVWLGGKLGVISRLRSK